MGKMRGSRMKERKKEEGSACSRGGNKRRQIDVDGVGKQNDTCFLLI